MHFFFKYLIFLWNSSNQHGVHSPFVYAFVTQCLYKKMDATKSTKSIAVLRKCKSYFRTEAIKIYTENELIKKKLAKELDWNTSLQPPYDLIYIDASALHHSKAIILRNEEMHNNTLVLLSDIYRTKESQHHWEMAKALPAITVTVDLFYCGLLFFRKEQLKEHFKIRI
ncbi:hypothetical protein U1E44_02860 [Arenibacter sp. GZD96]|uniref:hypothetical protein n=1 Tax=Aurantibrevibacter litoralis TaxID=3106030 RepID=UPI002AFF0399|nr:hypothetical protein [Arenibacter sp. GZD-96]MEA1785021.1 hypothetical protein [Arenibacter sp. GZD-96]